MRCLNCSDQQLRPIPALEGEFLRCLSCRSVYMAPGILEAFAQPPDAMKKIVSEAHALKLPIAKRCPRCEKPMFQGRSLSLGKVLTFCGSCQWLWCEPEVLRAWKEIDIDRLEKSIQEALRRRVQIEPEVKTAEMKPAEPTDATPTNPPSTSISISATPGSIKIELPGTTGSQNPSDVADVLKNLSKTLNTLAQQMNPADAPPAPPKKEDPPISLPAHSAPIEPPPPPTPQAPPPLMKPKEVGSSVHDPATQVSSLKLDFKKTKEPEPAASVPPVEAPLPPAPEPAAPVEPPPLGTVEPPKVVLPPPIVEMPSSPTVDAVPIAPNSTPSPVDPTPAPVSATTPLAPKKDPPKKPEPKPKSPGFFSKIFGSSAPAPKPAPKPAAAKPASAPLAPPKPKPTPAPAKVAPPTPAPAPVPVSESPKPAAPLAPPKAVTPAAAPKPKPPKVKVPSVGAVNRFKLSLPMLCVIIAIVPNCLREYGVDTELTIAWAVWAWFFGYAVRLIFVYPFKAFDPSTIAEIKAEAAGAKVDGYAVQVSGQIAIEKGPMGQTKKLLTDETGSIELNVFRAMEVMPKVFSLEGFGKMAGQTVTVQGWYRSWPSDTIEISAIPTKPFQKSSIVRAMRWTIAGIALTVATIVLVNL